MKTLFLSVGHNWGPKVAGGIPDQGAVANGTTEAIECKAVVDAVIRRGVPGIALVRVPEGLNLPQRIAWINARLPKSSEPFALEFHMDAGPSTAVGASVWYNDDNSYTMNEGKQFLAEYTRVTGLTSRHVNSDRTDRLGNLGFVSDTKCASLLIELGFITNRNELATVRAKAVDAVIAGIAKMNAS